MAVKFLDNLNLVGNQLLNTKLQVLAGNPTGVAILGEGQIFFDSTLGVKALKYYDGTDWIDPAGGIGGSGTVGTVPVFVTDATTLGDSALITSGSGSTQTFTFNTSGSTNFKGDIISTANLSLDNVAGKGGLKDKDGDLGTNGQLLSSTGTAVNWIDAPVSYTKWVLTGDSGTQDILDGNTVLITGGTGIVTGASATDKLTITPAFDEYSSVTPGSNAGLLFGLDGDMSNSEIRYNEVNQFSLSLFDQPTGNISFNSKKITSLADPTSAQDGATKSYVDSAVEGGLNVKGGFNATTGAITSGGNLTVGGTRVAVAIGDYYVVTVAGNFFANAATPLTPGDSVLVQTAAAAGASVEGDFAVIQSDTDLATLATVGIGNVNPDTAKQLQGIAVSYPVVTPGTALVGLDIKNMDPFSGIGTDLLSKSDIVAVYDTTEGHNKRTTVDKITALGNSNNSEVYTSASGTTHTFTHNLNTRNVSVQLFDTSSFDTVYATVVRTSVSVVTVTTAATADITCLITKVG